MIIGQRWRCGGMDGGAGGAGAHYCDADLGEGDSACCREVTLSADVERRSRHPDGVWTLRA